MCTTNKSSVSSSLTNGMKDLNENNENDDHSSYFDNDNVSDKDKEANFFKELESHDNIKEKSNDGHYGKVSYNIYYN